MARPSVAIIGAGIAGLSCARTLSAHFQVRVFDKGGRPGGRMASRPLPDAGAGVIIDHGAQHMSARTPEFGAFTQEAIRAGTLEPWRPRLFDEAAGQLCEWDRPEVLRGVPGANAVPVRLAAGIDISLRRRVVSVHRRMGLHELVFEDGGHTSGFDILIVATPAEQAADLLSGSSELLAQEAAGASTAPCIATAVRICGADPFPGAEAVRFAPDGILSWAARARGQKEIWILHAAPGFSRSYLGDAAAEAARMMADAFIRTSGERAGVDILLAHKWRYALVEKPAGTAFGLDPETRTASCGDWRIGPRIEAAFLSGRQLGLALAEAFG